MQADFWKTILMVAAFTGFLLGYALPPLVEVGMIGGDGPQGEVGIKSTVDQEMQEFYRDLNREQ